MNAVDRLLRGPLQPFARQLWQRAIGHELAQVDNHAAVTGLLAAYGGDLCSLLNLCKRDELLAALTGVQHRQMRLPHRTQAIVVGGEQPVGVLRAQLWHWGATLEAGGVDWIASSVQPLPFVIASQLTILRRPRGKWGACSGTPVEVPALTAPQRGDAPHDLDGLLHNAEKLLGMDLSARGKDKGAWGTRAAWLLGLDETGEDEPDFAGEVEVKTVAVAQDSKGWWRVVEDPAICMADESRFAPHSKLASVLWLARAKVSDEAGDHGVIIAWQWSASDAQTRTWLERDLHLRPKGPKGTTAKGWYLHKRFFADAGLLAVLNGGSVPMSL